MQGLLRMVRSCHEKLKVTILQNSQLKSTSEMNKIFARFGRVISFPTTQNKEANAIMVSQSTMQQKGLENTKVSDVLLTKDGEESGSWLCCRTNDTVFDAIKQMADNNIGSLVVLKPGENQLIAGIITERDYLRKVIVQDRSSKYTRVGDIMTEQSKLITVTSDTNILQAMQLMSEHHIRHVPVIDGKVVGMISVADIVKAVVEQQTGEVNQLNQFIRGDYY
ncbi:CBS domain-containing protein CBSX3, mitochondrial [Nicotiana tabacum]|uniref:CBS domain-containing protein CBSX3, mitochondrial n=1 Tax=Nicotiana tabacum TaxID=4097 RepID=A0A1S3XWD7_TOBAC|nr:CBS domain-containing protein CBSX3, mitochondrial [Nicotiana tomentosiformis]XP_009616924.1 CBS domain-containing protein CBSX3, mitochondrial [Nicotiana tomentosiformis]XP_016444189.1 PREDICTED: CBS domain-containing protein CBSX3, mitochondrial-like [Nicotiana tabacum]XP_016444190.1 PREDICTED: CBS domain-containing protein CBSX3, mitochondrial-like [Nicotiana tabacum]XP_018630813.1 CBS domain-containing protein CBSX3, mitochondrial [Nicotiana tomentosiformis]